MKSTLLYTLLFFISTQQIFAQAVTRTVCASGCDHATIQAAVNASGTGDFIEVIDAVHTESGISINKTLSICGADPSNIVQAASSPSASNGRIFSISSGVVVAINNMIIRNGGVSSNITGGAILNSGTLSVSYCTLSDNQANRGGAIASSGAGTISINNCTFLNNSVADGGLNNAEGGALYLGTLNNTIINSTFTLNQNNTATTGNGGAITVLNGATLEMIFVTIAGNTIGGSGTGAGVASLTGSNLSLTNTIISDNTGNEDLHIDGTLLTNVTNIVLVCNSSVMACGTFLTGSPALLTLDDIGGCTETLDLGGASAAISSGTAIAAITADQRGQARSLLPNPDIGAVQLSASEPPCTGAILCIDAALPVELVSFNLKKQNRNIQLFWETATEVQNEGFEILKSNNGKDWEKIGFVNGRGESEVNVQYEFLDTNPFSGYNYYRLRQIDFDGAFEYSDIRVASFENLKETTTVFPNPVNDEFLVEFSEEKSGLLLITDPRGQVMLDVSIVSNRKVNLSVSEMKLTAGMYWIQFHEEGSQTPEYFTFMVAE